VNESEELDQNSQYSQSDQMYRVDESGHVPVLFRETLECLAARTGDVYVDLTAGRGGHAAAVARLVAPSGRVVLFDLDAGNLAYASERVRRESGLEPTAIQGSFVSVQRELTARGIVADLVLADLGFASTQVDDPARGLSFLRDGPLDMRLDPTSIVTARDIVNGSSERELADIMFRFGDEPLAKKIARKITDARAVAPINTTAQLADLVRDAYGSRARTSRMHPATKAFMAIRIAVNDELGALDALLGSIRSAALRVHEGAPTWLSRGARVAVIGFHSLEDRLVKRSFATMQRDGLCTEITNGALVSSDSESAVNPRARSAKLRAVMVDRADEV
jgi:16S rRNA (cytosine1402-N4)-methyltransferase